MWSQTLSLSSYASRQVLAFDQGVEPAIELDGKRHDFFDRKRVSIRWLCGTCLTGLLGALLIGSTIYAALDDEANVAEEPSLAKPIVKDTGDAGLNPHKGDRLVKPVDIVAAKQDFRVATPTKMGDKEILRMHDFARVETTLLTTTAGFGDEVPPFNPLKVLADARAPVEAVPEPEQDDPDFAWTTRDLAPHALSTGVTLSDDEVQAQVAEQMKSSNVAGNRPFVLPSQLLLLRTSRAGATGALAYAGNGMEPFGGAASPFSSIVVRMVPENETVVPRSPAPSGQSGADEKLVTMHRGETLQNLLFSAGVNRETVTTLLTLLDNHDGQQPVRDGRRIKLQFSETDLPAAPRVLSRLQIYNDEQLDSTVALRDDGTYVRLAPADSAPAPQKPASDDDDENGMRLYNALYETALKQEIPKPLIDDMVRIFANDVDFQRAVAGGDTFSAFYQNGDADGGPSELLYASITTRGETYRYYRFQSPDDGTVDYYDANGRSTRKFLVRAPMLNFKITSGFGMRYHPILGYTRPHTGVDFAAPIGSPIFAAGNGTIAAAGRSLSYGRRIEIQHANGYVTTYNHLSGFARGIAEGIHVRQGQVIGYLGQTGLATGPHLHYEVLVNGHFVDPMRVKLARTKEFDSHTIGLFTKERDRINELLQHAPNANAQVASQH